MTGWLRIGGPLLVVALLIGWAITTRVMLQQTRQQRDAAIADVTAFRRLATDATVPPDAAGNRPLLSAEDAKAALAGAFRDRDDARATLTGIDRASKAAKIETDASDAALTKAQSDNLREFARVAPRIAELATAKPSGVPAEDAEAIDVDSRAAWEAWR